jgi:small subunit ribosomal protein S6e
MMAKFKIIVSDPEEGNSRIVELEEARAAPLIGRRIGETLDGSVVDLAGHKIQITGGSDKDGFPMRPDVHGGVRRKVVLSGGVGFNAPEKGMLRRKAIRGNIVTDEIVQLNMKIVEKPKGTKAEKKPKEKEEASSEEEGKKSEAQSKTEPSA